MPSVGDDFGDFAIDGLLGRGGMGLVFSATQRRLSRPVALKVMSPQLSVDESYQSRFAREAEVLSQISSPHIVHVYDYGQHEDCLYLATQLVRGGDLGAWLQTRGPLTVPQALTVTAQVCRALADAHEVGVLHRDVKPGNILLRDETLRHVYLADFGTARARSSDLTRAGDQVGTLAYMAPEVCLGEGATEASDVYSAGCVLWKALTGSAPYAGVDLQVASGHINGPVPQLGQGTPGLDEVLARALAKEPEDRFKTASEMAVTLEEMAAGSGAAVQVDPTSVRPQLVAETLLRPRGLATHQVGEQHPPTPTPELAPAAYLRTGGGPPQRRTWPLLLAAALALLVVIGAAGWWLSGHGDQDASAHRGGSATASGSASRGSVDGDRLSDLVVGPYGVDQPAVVAMSQGGGFAEPQPWTESLSAAERPHRLLADVNGDGRTDLVDVEQIAPDQRQDVVVRLSDGTSFGEGRTWSTVDPIDNPGDENFASGDFNDDGRDDLARITFTVGQGVRVEVSTSSGRAFSGARRWIEQIPARYDYSRFLPGDFDGDGRTDLVLALPLQGGLQLNLLHSTGRGFENAKPWGLVPGAAPDTSRLLAGDFDGDGLSDVADYALAPGAGTRVVVLRSTSKSFSDPVSWYRDPDTRPSDSWARSGWYDRDRQTDISLLVDDGAGGSEVRVLRARTGRFEDGGVVATLPDYSFTTSRPLGMLG